MAVSCHFRDRKLLLVTSLKQVSRLELKRVIKVWPDPTRRSLTRWPDLTRSKSLTRWRWPLTPGTCFNLWSFFYLSAASTVYTISAEQFTNPVCSTSRQLSTELLIGLHANWPALRPICQRCRNRLPGNTCLRNDLETFKHCPLTHSWWPLQR